jgi:hypothetical protein
MRQQLCECGHDKDYHWLVPIYPGDTKLTQFCMYKSGKYNLELLCKCKEFKPKSEATNG